MRIDRAKLAELESRVELKIARYRVQGAEAAQSGLALQSCPYAVGSWAWNHWVEGLSGSRCPTRIVVNGTFNMSPAEEVHQRLTWLNLLGVSDQILGAAVSMWRHGYTEQALGRTQ